MKKIVIILFCATALFASCNKTTTEKNGVKSAITISAISENSTKAGINSSNEVIWTTGDQIGVRLYKGTTYDGTDSGSGYDAWDETFTLSKGAGTSIGTFTSDKTADEYVHYSYAAFYPKFDNNVNNGDRKVYFHLLSQYDNYVSGQVLTPLVANLSADGLDQRPTRFVFNQVAGTILVHLKDIPAAANRFSLSIDGKDITGWVGIDPLAVNGLANSAEISSIDSYAGNIAAFRFNAADDARDMDFYVPVPTMTNPVITIKLYHNNTAIWTKSSTKAQPSIERGTLLEMESLTIPSSTKTDYAKGGESTWAIIGDAVGGWELNTNEVPLYEIGNTGWLYRANVNMARGKGFQLVTNHTWTGQLGLSSPGDITLGGETTLNGSKDMYISGSEEGNYDIYLNPADKKLFIIQR